MALKELFQIASANLLRLKMAIDLVWNSAPGWTMVSMALMLIQGILPLATLYLTKLLVDEVTHSATSGNGISFSGPLLLIVLLGTVALLTALFRSLSGYVKEAQSQLVTDKVQGIIHAKSVEADLEYYENSKYYDALHRAQQEAPFRPTKIVNGLAQIGQSGTSLGAIAVLLISFNWAIALLLFASAIPGIVVRLIFSEKKYQWQRQRTQVERKAAYYNWMLTGEAHAKEIRLFGLGPHFIAAFRNLREQLRKERLGLAFWLAVIDFATQISAVVAIYASLGYIAYRAFQGAITLGDLVMYYQAFQTGMGSLQQILGAVAGLYEDNLFLSSFYEFMDLKQNVLDPQIPRQVPYPLRRGIEFTGVSFQYPHSTRSALKDVSLIIKPGEVVAIVGENGSGKTTLVKLLCRLYDPNLGSITLDGIDLCQFSAEDLRRHISVLFQDYIRYSLTARENIWFGDVNSPPDTGKIEEAAQLSGAHPIIEGMTGRYDSLLGNWFDGGEELSIGEWQKVAMARAFMRDSQIVVLDEPTSSLDAISEYQIFERFKQLAKGKIAIIISHRLSTTKMADRIYVMEEGRITDSGPHEELIQRCKKYALLFETQAQYYR